MTKRIFLTGAVLAGFAVDSPMTFGGWTGQMNGAGFGRASVNITPAGGVNKPLATPLTSNPGAAMPIAPTPPSGVPFTRTEAAPPGTAQFTSAAAQGAAGYVWRASTLAAGGDKTDNVAIESLNLGIVPQENAFASFNSDPTFDANQNLTGFGAFGFASAGSAVLLRGYEWIGDGVPTDADLDGLSPDLFNTLFFQPYLGSGEFLTDTEVNIRFFEFNYSLEGKNPDNVYVFIDGLAESVGPNVPDSGPMGFAFAATVLGLAFARRNAEKALA